MGKATPSTDSKQRPIQEKCIFSYKCILSLVGAIVLIGFIICVLYFLISLFEKYINTSNETFLHITHNYVNSCVDMSDGNYDCLLWPFALVSSVAICAVTFIICKILSILRDLIENEQIKHHYNH